MLTLRWACFAAEIAVESAGACSGNWVRVWRNGQLINFRPGRGLNVYVFRGENLSFVGSLPCVDTACQPALARCFLSS